MNTNSTFKLSIYKIFKPTKIFFAAVFVFLMVGMGSVSGAIKTWDRGANTNNWGDANNWNPNGVPASGDDVTIGNGFTISVNVVAVCNSFTITGGGTTTPVTISGTNSLTVTNGILIGAGSGFGDNILLNVGAGSLSCASITVTATGNANRSSGVTLSSGTVNVSGGITMGDVNDDFTFTGAGTLNVGGNMSGGTFTPSTGTVNCNGAAQTVGAYTYNNLTLSGSGTKTLQTGTTSITGNLTLSGTATATTVANLTIGGNLDVGTGTTFATGTNFTLGVTGTSNITGTLTLAGTGTKTFTGNATINSGGIWNETGIAAINFGGSLTNNAATFTSNTGTHTFSGSGKTIGGASTNTIPTATFTGSYTNSGTLTCATLLTVTVATLTNTGVIYSSTSLTGSGTLSNTSGTVNITGGSCSVITNTNGGTYAISGTATSTTAVANFTNTGSVYISGSGNITGITNNAAGTVTHSGLSTIGSFNNATATSTLNISTTPTVPTFITLTATTPGNTVNYNGAGNQTVMAVTYSNLKISGSGTKTLGGATTVTGVLTLTNGILSTNTTNLLSATNTSTAAIVGGSTTSYINGPINWTLPAGLGSGSNYIFPVGNITYLPFTLANPTTGSGVVTAQVQAFDANSGGTTNSTLASISTTEYWSLATVGNFTNSSVSLTRQTAITPNDGIATCATVGGVYTYIGGTLSAKSVMNSNLIGSNRFFVFGKGNPVINVSTNILSTFTYAYGYGPSNQLSFDVNGTGLSTNIIVYPTESFEISLTSGASFFPLSIITLPVNNGTVTLTTIYVRMKAGFSVGAVTPSSKVTCTSDYATTQNITCSGTVINSPVITLTPTSLSGFNYNVSTNGPSSPQTFTVSGSNLTDNIVLTPPTDYEISSTSGTTGFVSTTITLTQSSGSVGTTTIWVRLIGSLTVNVYNETLVASTNTSTTPAIQNLALNGSVNQPSINVSTFSLGGFIYTSGSGPSGVQSFNVNGQNLTANIIFTAPANFEISLSSGSGFTTTTLPLTPNGSGIVSSTTIYVRLVAGITTSSSTIIPPINLTATSTGAIQQNVSLSGQVVSSITSISSNATLVGFVYTVGSGGPSVKQSFTVSGTSLGSNNIVVTAPTNFEISSDNGTTWVSSFQITPDGNGLVNAYPVSLRLKGSLGLNSYSGNITLVAGTNTQNISCSGIVINTPSITAGITGSTCSGTTINLTSSAGSGTTNIYWTGPNGYYSTNPSPSIASITTANNGTYTVNGSTLSNVNILTNGGFEDGNSGFGTSYLFYTYGNIQTDQDTYTIGPKPSTKNTGFCTTSGGHTGNNQMIIDGATLVAGGAGVIAWAQSISVAQNTNYQFSFWVQSLVTTSPAVLQLYVNGVPVGTPSNAPSASCTWQQFFYTTNSGSNTTLQLTLVDLNLVANGNDFALDDIVFQQFFPVSSPVVLNVNLTKTPGVSITASANPLYSGGSVTFTAAPVYGGTSPTYQWYKGGSAISGETNSTLIYSPATGDVFTCVMTSNYPCISGSNPVTSNALTAISRNNYWIGGTTGVETDWGTATNWTGGYIPSPGNDVEYATGANYGYIAKSDLVLDQNRTIGSLINNTPLRLVIPAGIGLIVNNTITNDNSVDRIYIYSSSTGANGSLTFHNTSAVNATVEMYSSSNWNPGGVQDLNTGTWYYYNWQYFGIPLTTVKASPTFDGWYVRKWDQTGTTISNHWVSLTNDDYLSPFNGYEITQKSTTGGTILFQGQLVNSNFNSANPLTITSDALFPGQYVFSNPYTAAIDIRQITLGSGTDGAVYLYYTGTFGSWSIRDGGFNLDGVNPLAGQYVSVPINLAGSTQIPRQIPSMGSMLIRPFNKTINANYNISLVYNNVVMNNTVVLRAKDDVNITSEKIGIIIDVKGANAADRMWLFSEPKSNYGFDNGWDGQKIPGSALAPQIYAIEKDGNYQVNTVPDMNDTELAFQAGQDLEDTLTFTNMNLEKQYAGVYLVDLVENKTIDITVSGSTYAFVAESTPAPVKRFKIVTRPYEKDASDADTQVKIFSSQESIFVQNYSSLDGECRVYDIAGHYLMKVPFSANSVTAVTNSLRPGAYIGTAIAGSEKVSKRLIVR